MCLRERLYYVSHYRPALLCIQCDSHRSMWMCVCVFTYAQKETLLPGVFESFEIIISISIIILSIRFTCTANIYTNCKWLLTIFILIHLYPYIRRSNSNTFEIVHNFQSIPTKNKWRWKKKKENEAKTNKEFVLLINKFNWIVCCKHCKSIDLLCFVAQHPNNPRHLNILGISLFPRDNK